MKEPNKKTILFNLIANKKVGLGHLFRCAYLAKGFPDCKIKFLCSSRDKKYIKNFLDQEIQLLEHQETNKLSIIKANKPLLIINDVLSTEKNFVNSLANLGIKVVNFEDLGSGANCTDLTINQIYENKIIDGPNILWGHNYFFLRDEFDEIEISHTFKKLKNIILTFGGSDQHNLSKEIYQVISEFCYLNDINISIVTGPGYEYLTDLKEYVLNRRGVELIISTGTISKIMQKSQLAISSNGRTVYELAHMNVPGIIISQHKRESLHTFSNKENGFINIGIYEKDKTAKKVLKELKVLKSSEVKLSNLFSKVSNYDFSLNKNKVIDLIREVLNSA